MKGLKYAENVPHYEQWIKDGNTNEDYIEPERVYTPEEIENKTRREQVIAFRDYLIGGGNLTQAQVRKFMIAVIDRMM